MRCSVQENISYLCAWIICICMGCLLFISSSFAANTDVWEAFVAAKQQGQRLPLPDFSYAGYARGVQGIPNPNWTVYDVTEFGALPNDNHDDLQGVNDAIQAAQNANGGIVFFPKGRYLLSERQNIKSALVKISGGNIILRGEGAESGGTELFFRHHLVSNTPDKKWTTPPMISASGSSSSSKGSFVTTVTDNAQLGDFSFNVANAGNLKAGDYIVINLNDPDAANNTRVAPYQVENNWSRFKQGEIAREFHQIDSIDDARITLKEPLHMDIDSRFNWEIRKITLARQFGIENMALLGNWKGSYIHHKDIIHDSGWTAIEMSKFADSWVKNVRWVDWNETIGIRSSISVSLINVVLEGNRGHCAVDVQNSYGVLVTHSHDRVNRGQYHSQGVSGHAAGTVFHRNSWPEDTTFDTHAAFPHATLFDRVDGGFSGASGGSGGSDANQPNHMRDLVLWNFKDLGAKSGVSKNWWQLGVSKYGRVLMPKLIGWHGVLPRFNSSQLALNESFGQPVEPESLYEAQLALRLGKLPDWLVELNGDAPAPLPPSGLNVEVTPAP